MTPAVRGVRPQRRGWFAVMLGIVALAFACGQGVAQALFVEPDCPDAEDSVAVGATDPGGYIFGFEPPVVTVEGNVVRVEARLYMTFPEPPRSSVRAMIGRLPVGQYRFELYTRAPNSTGFDPPRLAGTQDFQVYEVAPSCGGSNIAVAGTPFMSAPVGTPYPTRIAVRVTDAHGLPAKNFKVNFERVNTLDPPPSGPRPDITPSYDLATTSPEGIASIPANANTLPGVYQYRAWFRKADHYVSTYVTLYNAPPGSSIPDYPVVEFYNGLLLHYFMTGNVAEMEKLDRSPWWSRTGGVFLAFGRGAGRPGTVPVCRFYGLPSAGLDSHFFSASADECASVQARFSNAWILETDDAFELYLPDTKSGACPLGSAPIYRAHNNLPDANHRYAESAGVLRSSPYRSDSPGWTPEGYGPDAVAMCAPL